MVFSGYIKLKWETKLCSPPHCPSCSVPNLTSELFTLQPNFTPIQTTHTVPNNNNAWGGRMANTHKIMQTYNKLCSLMFSCTSKTTHTAQSWIHFRCHCSWLISHIFSFYVTMVTIGCQVICWSQPHPLKFTAQEHHCTPGKCCPMTWTPH